MEASEHSAVGPIIPESFVSLNMPVPPNAAAAFGYPGSADFVAFHWEPLGDELCYDDGRIAGTGDWHLFLRYRLHPEVIPTLAPWNIGYSDEEAEHWLVLELNAGKAWIAEVADARAFLQSQHSPEPPLRMVDLPRVREEIRIAVSQQTVAAERVRELHRRQQAELQRMLMFCDLWRSR
jgi:hypothetical protein